MRPGPILMVRPPRHRPFIAIALVIVGAVAGMWAPSVHAQSLIFADGFESGDLSAWNAPPPVVPIVQMAVSTIEITEAVETLQLTVSVLNQNNQEIRVDWATANGTATEGADFSPAAGTLVLAGGENSGTIEIQILDDLLVETDEDLTVSLSNPQNATLGQPVSTGITIADDDTYPEVAFTSNEMTVGEADGSLDVPVTLTWAYPTDVSVDVAATASSATAGEDYDLENGTLTIPAGETTGTISVAILDDVLDENDETFTLTLSNPQSAILGDPSIMTVTITDDDLSPNVAFSEATVMVGEDARDDQSRCRAFGSIVLRSYGEFHRYRWFGSWRRGLHGHKRHTDHPSR